MKIKIFPDISSFRGSEEFDDDSLKITQTSNESGSLIVQKSIGVELSVETSPEKYIPAYLILLSAKSILSVTFDYGNE